MNGEDVIDAGEKAASRAQRSIDGWRVGRVDIGTISRQSLQNLYEHDGPGRAAEIAYNACLTFLPFLLVLACLPTALASVFSIQDLPGRVEQGADSVLSKDVASMVRWVLGEVSRSAGWGAFLLGAGGTLWSGMSTMSAIRKALNRIYDRKETLSYFPRKVFQASLAALTACLVLSAFLTLLIGPSLVDSVLGLATRPLVVFCAAALVLSAIAVLYWLAPAGTNSFRWITPGAIFFALTWLCFSLLFNIYLSELSTVNRFYGSLGVVILLLAWLYGSSLALLLGAELNAGIGQRFDPQVESDPPPLPESG